MDVTEASRAPLESVPERAELPVTECSCFGNTWCGDSRIEHYGLQHHTWCDGHGNRRDVPRAVETDGDGWCLCAKHQEWKRDIQAWAQRRRWTISDD